MPLRQATLLMFNPSPTNDAMAITAIQLFMTRVQALADIGTLDPAQANKLNTPAQAARNDSPAGL